MNGAVRNNNRDWYGYIRVVLYIVIMFLVVSLGSNFGRLRRIRSEIKRTELDLSLLWQENEVLKKNFSEVGSPDYRETQIREKLGLAREGEIVLVLPDPEVLRQLSPRVEMGETEKNSKPNWVLWWELFVI